MQLESHIPFKDNNLCYNKHTLKHLKDHNFVAFGDAERNVYITSGVNINDAY
jgi:hypothetical protein